MMQEAPSWMTNPQVRAKFEIARENEIADRRKTVEHWQSMESNLNATLVGTWTYAIGEAQIIHPIYQATEQEDLLFYLNKWRGDESVSTDALIRGSYAIERFTPEAETDKSVSPLNAFMTR